MNRRPDLLRRLLPFALLWGALAPSAFGGPALPTTILHLPEANCPVLAGEGLFLKPGHGLFLAIDASVSVERFAAATIDRGFAPLAGAPNFRFALVNPPAKDAIYGLAQPSAQGIDEILRWIREHDPAHTKLRVLSLRQEPVLFLKGKTYSLRAPEGVDRNLTFGSLSAEKIDQIESAFKTELLGEIARTGGTVQVYDPEKAMVIALTLAPGDVRTMREMYASIGPSIVLRRVPIPDETAPGPAEIAAVLREFAGEARDGTTAVHCHYGYGRTTLCMAIALLAERIRLGDAFYPKTDFLEVGMKTQLRARKPVPDLVAALGLTDAELNAIEKATYNVSTSLNMIESFLKKSAYLGSAEARTLTPVERRQVLVGVQRYLVVLAGGKYLIERRNGRTTLDYAQWILGKGRAAAILAEPL